MFPCLERKKPCVKCEPQDTPKPMPPSTGDRRDQRFPTGYKEKTIARYNKAVVGAGLLGRQRTSHIAWYKSMLLKGQKRYQIASDHVKAKTGYTIPWQVIGVMHGLEASFNFNKQLLNGQAITKRTTWVPKGRGPWPTWEDSCVDAFTWDDDYKIVPKKWGVAETALFFERWNGMTYWNWGKPSPYIWGFCSVQVPGKFVEDGKYSSSAITLQVGALVQLKNVEFFNG